MYDEATRRTALDMVSKGLTPLEVSRMMGGKPSKTTIRMWLRGEVPVGRRSARTQKTLQEKLDALRRIEAGEDYHLVAKDLGCAPQTLLTWRRRYAESGQDGIKTYWDIRSELENRVRNGA